jgi:hypothetical protein
MQRLITAKSIVNIWMAGTLTMIAIKADTLGEGLSKDKRIERSRWGKKTYCMPPGFCKVPPMKSQKNLR